MSEPIPAAPPPAILVTAVLFAAAFGLLRLIAALDPTAGAPGEGP